MDVMACSFPCVAIAEVKCVTLLEIEAAPQWSTIPSPLTRDHKSLSHCFQSQKTIHVALLTEELQPQKAFYCSRVEED